MSYEYENRGVHLEKKSGVCNCKDITPDEKL